MKRLISMGLIATVMLTSCKFGTTNGVQKPYENLITSLEEQNEQMQSEGSKFRVDQAKKIQLSAETLIADLNKTKKFSRKYYTFESEKNITQRLSDMNTRVSNAISKCQDNSIVLQKGIYEIGRQNYLAGKKMTKSNAQLEAVSNEILTLHSLQYIKRVYETCASITYHYMNEYSVEQYDVYPQAIETRKNLLKHFMGLVGMLKIINKDSLTVSKNLKDLETLGALDAQSKVLIENLANDMKEATSELQSFSNQFFEQTENKEMLAELGKFQDKAEGFFEGQSLLFDPANPDHIVVHILVILSNLTWGAVQSSIGLGIVLSHALILTPLSWMLKPFFPYSIQLLRGPGIEVANNKMQLYADVCGFPAIPSKMSMGIWELDFCTGKSFASGHEGGHAKQSALLGPFYLPAAILSYTLNLGHGGFIEHWADDWSVTRVHI